MKLESQSPDDEILFSLQKPSRWSPYPSETGILSVDASGNCKRSCYPSDCNSGDYECWESEEECVCHDELALDDGRCRPGAFCFVDEYTGDACSECCHPLGGGMTCLKEYRDDYRGAGLSVGEFKPDHSCPDRSPGILASEGEFTMLTGPDCPACPKGKCTFTNSEGKTICVSGVSEKECQRISGQPANKDNFKCCD